MTALLPHHRALIEASSITSEVAADRGYWSATEPGQLREFGDHQRQLVPALVIPTWTVHGRVAFSQLRPDDPRVEGKPRKYELPVGCRLVIDVPPRVRPILADPRVPLLITEGARKADAAVSAGLHAIDLVGVWGWRGTNEHGGKVALPDHHEIAWNDRRVFLCFDSDVMTKLEVWNALRQYREFLRSRDADVQVIYLPGRPDGAKVGLDDFLAAGHGTNELWALAGPELRKPSGASGEAVVQIRRALLKDAQDTRDTSGPAREEVPGSGGLLHRGVAAILFGERGQGKSSVGLAIGMGAAAEGERVLYLDRENGASLTRERVEAILDANPEWGDPLADERFVGRHYPALDQNWRPDDFGEAVAGEGFTVVLYDSTREMLTQLGLDPNSDADLSRLHDLLVTPLRRRGVAVALMDNVGHAATHRPKGSGAKLDAAEQAFKVTTSSKFSAVEVGLISIVCSRSRYGDQDRQWTMRVGGGVWELPEATSEAPDARQARKVRERIEAFRLACVAALRDRGPLGRDPLLSAVRKRGVTAGKTQRGWLSELAADPASGIVFDAANGYDLAPSGPPGPESRTNPGPTPSEDDPGPPGPPRRGDHGPGSLVPTPRPTVLSAAGQQRGAGNAVPDDGLDDAKRAEVEALAREYFARKESGS